jgi:hypothetical protein
MRVIFRKVEQGVAEEQSRTFHHPYPPPFLCSSLFFLQMTGGNAASRD